MAKKWTKQETELLHQIRNLYTKEELAEMFDCTAKQIYNKLNSEKLIFKGDKPIDLPGYKTCPGCTESLPFKDYNKHNGKKDGLQSYCKSCSTRIKSLNNRKINNANSQKEKDKQAFIDSFKGVVMHCPNCGDQSINEYRIYWESRTQSFKKRCKKCSTKQTTNSMFKRIKKQGYI